LELKAKFKPKERYNKTQSSLIYIYLINCLNQQHTTHKRSNHEIDVLRDL